MECFLFFFSVITIVWGLLTEARIRKLRDVARNHKEALHANAYALNMSIMDLALYVKLALQEKAKTTELTEEERAFFDKAHSMIPEIEKVLKNFKKT